jgi:hypothetical protein
MPRTQRQLTLLTCKALLYAENRTFKVLSCPMPAHNKEGREIIVGHDGSSLLHLTPVSILANDATANAQVLLLVL